MSYAQKAVLRESIFSTPQLVPQGLNPTLIWVPGGTSKLVPCYKALANRSANESFRRPRIRALTKAGARCAPRESAHLREAEVHFACAGVGPAACHNFGSSVKLNAVGTVHVQIAEERRLPSAEAVVRDGHGDGHVDADHANLDIELKLARGAAVLREDCGAVAVGILVDEAKAFSVCGDAHDAEHRAENLGVVAAHAGLGVVDERRTKEESIAVCGGIETAIDGKRCALGDGCVEMASNAVAMLAGDERAHFAGRLGAGTNLDAGHALADGGDERIGDVADGEHDGDGHTPLTGCAVTGGNSGIGGHGHVGIRKYHDGILR